MIMLDVVVALLPAMVVSLYIFGWNALRLLAACVGACLLTEYACRRAMGRDPGITDLSAVVTGILLALNLPPRLPTWMAVVGCVVAIAVAKQVFGGIGYNPFNPALVGRVALLVSFPVAMTTWTEWRIPVPLGTTDAVTTATPLGLLKTSLAAGEALPYAFDGTTALQFFLGSTNGCLGEVSTAAMLLGGMYLLVRRCISWHTPVAYVGTVFVFALVLHLGSPERNMAPLLHVLSGGLMLGAVFMATDMVTTPVTGKGKLVFGVGCGLLTMIIRKWGGYPEGVSFAILLMNAVTPLINRATRPRVFGRRRGK
jgi:electron transport complex protein RnfD